MASRLLGWRTQCAVELDAFARRVLLARQRDGHLDRFPIWDDIKTFDGRPWRGSVDVVSGGFPCQDVSAAGTGKGLAGSRSGLVFEMLRVARETQPTFVFSENSPRLRTRGLGTIIEELTGMGFDVRWCVLGAWHIGAPHRRDRMWLLATHPDRLALWDAKQRQEGRRHNVQDSGLTFSSDDGEARDLADAERARLEGHRSLSGQSQEPELGDCGSQLADADRRRRKEFWQTFVQPEQHSPRRHFLDGRRQRWPDDPADGQVEPFVGRVISDDVAAGVDRCSRLRAIGNGQVPAVARLAWNILRGLR